MPFDAFRDLRRDLRHDLRHGAPYGGRHYDGPHGGRHGGGWVALVVFAVLFVAIFAVGSRSMKNRFAPVPQQSLYAAYKDNIPSGCAREGAPQPGWYN